MAFIEHIFLETTNICNARCITCMNSKMKRKKGVMSFELFTSLIDDITKDRKTSMLHLSGYGEPYMTPNFLDYCNYAIPKLNEARIGSEIITNGELVTDIPVGLSSLIFSFNAGKKDTYEKITGLNYDKVVANIFRLKDQFKNVASRVQIHMLAFEDNKDEVEAFKTLFAPLKEQNVLLRIGYKYDNQTGLVEDKTLDKFKTEEKQSCHYVKNVLWVNWDGSVISCCHDVNGVNVIGNIKESSIDDVIFGGSRRELLIKHLKGNFDGICKNCNFNVSFEGKYEYV